MTERNETGGLFVEEKEQHNPPVVVRTPPAESRHATPETPAESPVRRPTLSELTGSLERIEHSLVEIRRVLGESVRERRHKEFSPARLVASLLQALVVGLLLWALSDWAFGEPGDVLLTKLAFAAVLQLSSLTGFVLGREVD